MPKKVLMLIFFYFYMRKSEMEGLILVFNSYIQVGCMYKEAFFVIDSLLRIYYLYFYLKYNHINNKIK